MSEISGTLCFAGVLLFLFGLAAGFGIPAFASHRLGLSAHLTGVQSGTALVAFGLLWPHLSFWNGWGVPTGYGLWISLYVLFAGMALGAVWATGRSLPIAGAGRPALPWQERVVQTMLALGAFGTLIFVLAVIAQWIWAG